MTDALPNNRRLKGKRKFIVAMTTLMMSFIAVLVGEITGAEFVTLDGLIVGLYSGAEMGEAFVKRGQ